AVLFHRSLYERYGGFAEDMDQLEDWNLWTRYTLEDDFVLVEKTTSKYRVPASAREAAAGQTRLDRGYRDAVEREEAVRVVACGVGYGSALLAGQARHESGNNPPWTTA